MSDSFTRTPMPGDNDPATPRLIPLRGLLEEWEADAAARYAAKQSKKPLGAVTGLARLDRELGDALSPGLHVVHGGPGCGKTAFALQAAGACGCPAVYVSAEMAPLELLRRTTARITGTYLGRLKSGELPPDESLALARRAAAACPKLALVDATRAWASRAFLQQVAEAVRGNDPHLLIIVDSIHSWAEGVPSESPEYEVLNTGLAHLRALARGLDCPVLAIAERNRMSMKAGGTPFYHPKYYYTVSGLTLYESQAAATTAGEMNPRFFRKLVFSTIEPEANAILVVANSDQDGRRLYSKLFVDFASIKNPNVVNYLGRYKPEVVEIMGMYSCAGINWAARTIFQATRRRHIIVRFECDYDPLLAVGKVITLHGYGDFRIQSFSARFDKQTWHHAQIEAEYIETGYGLPTGTPTT